MGLLHVIFRKFVKESWPKIGIRISFPLNIWRTNWQNFTKFYKGPLKSYFTTQYFKSISLSFNKICNSPWHWIVKFSQDVQCYALPRFTHWLPHLFFSTWHLVTNLFIIFQTFSMVFMSRQFPSHSRTGIPLHSWNVLVLLELWHGAVSCIKIYPFCGKTTHSRNISISLMISLWYFALSMLPFIFLWREMHLLLMVSQTCTLTCDFTVEYT